MGDFVEQMAVLGLLIDLNTKNIKELDKELTKIENFIHYITNKEDEQK